MKIKSIVTNFVRFLNVPEVKQGTKNVISIATAAFGVLAAYDMSQVLLKKRYISTWYPCPKGDYEKFHQISVFCAKVSLIAGALVSVPGVKLISMLTAGISKETLERCFGPNTIFAINPWHPRHVVSIVGAAFSVPIFISSICFVFKSRFDKLNCASDSFDEERTAKAEPERKVWFSDRRVLLVCIPLFFLSRPMLHKLNPGIG